MTDEEMKYEKHKNKDGTTIPCASCDSEVETFLLKNYEDKMEFFCQFCCESVGHRHSEISKQLLANMFNTLFKKLKETKQE
ncbi:MAG TPA: hypothetical protein P5270_09900 [Victivallales bacterium]|nr:hypothetical protein [Victivallales bacterium]